MPHRRRVRKNSFGGDLDDLVKHFPEQPCKPEKKDESVPKEERDIHHRLFERAWRHSGPRRPEN